MAIVYITEQLVLVSIYWIQPIPCEITSRINSANDFMHIIDVSCTMWFDGSEALPLSTLNCCIPCLFCIKVMATDHEKNIAALLHISPLKTHLCLFQLELECSPSFYCFLPIFYCFYCVFSPAFPPCEFFFPLCFNEPSSWIAETIIFTQSEIES